MFTPRVAVLLAVALQSGQIGLPPTGVALPSPFTVPDQAGWPVWVEGSQNGYPSEMAVADVDADGELEVVVTDYAGIPYETKLYVFDHRGNLEPGWPVGFDGKFPAHPVVGDIDGNGDLEIFVGYYGFQHTGDPIVAWPKSVASCASFDLQVTGIVDVDGDDQLDVLGMYSQGVTYAGDPCYPGAQIHAWNGSGHDLPGFPIQLPAVQNGHSVTLRAPVAGDLDGDGALEIVAVGIQQNFLIGDVTEAYAYRNTGEPVPGWPVLLQSGPNVSFAWPHTPSVADLDGDGADEVVLSLGLVGNGAELHVLSGDGTPLSGWPKVLPEPVSAPLAVSVGDVDASPGLEIVATRELAGSVVETLVWNAAGDLLPGWPRSVAGYEQSWSGASGSYYWVDWSVPILADVAGDARLEILHALESTSTNEHVLFAWRADGVLLAQALPHLSGTVFAGSLLATDLDLDGDVELGLVARHGPGRTTLHFWDVPRAFKRGNAWPMWGHDPARTNRAP